MKRAVKAFFGMSVLGFSGCVSYQDLNSSEPLASFDVGSDYRTVYRKLVTKARACNPVSSFVINGDLFEDNHTARISSSAPGPTELVAYIVDIKSTADMKTHVELRSWGATGTKLARNLKDWATDEKAACDSTVASNSDSKEP